MDIALKDAVGAEVKFCLDGSIRRNTRDRFYWGTFYPDDNSGQLVERGSAAEESIIALLKQIVCQWYSEAEQKALTGVYGKRALSEEERKTALCLDVIERVKQALK